MAGRTRNPSYDFKNYPPTPEDLSEGGQAVWVAITRQFTANHFASADLVLLLEFCRSAELIEECNDIVRREGSIIKSANGEAKAHPSIGIRNAEIKNLATLGTKLRLPLSSRFRAESRGNEPVLTKPWGDELGSLIARPDDVSELLA